MKEVAKTQRRERERKILEKTGRIRHTVLEREKKRRT